MHPRIADIEKVKKKIRNLPEGTIVRMGGMTDCFQPLELEQRITYQAIQELNRQGIRYLIVTKSSIVARPEYRELFDRNLAHIQITVTTLDAERAWSYERASPPNERTQAIMLLQDAGFDVSIRLSPIVEEFMDFDRLNSLGIQKGIVEFLRINSWIKQWFRGVDYSRYTHRQGGYCHLPLEEKRRVLEQIQIPDISVCEDVTEHYQYWKEYVNPNKEDCCNLRLAKEK